MKEMVEKYSAAVTKMISSLVPFEKTKQYAVKEVKNEQHAVQKAKNERYPAKEAKNEHYPAKEVKNEKLSPFDAKETNFLAESDLSDMPDDRLLKFWASSEWSEYQAWIFHNDFLSCDAWKRMRKKSLTFKKQPLISLLMPAYNTDTDMLWECIRSVQAQAYPRWEMCIADDGSTSPETLEQLKKSAASEHRIKLSLSTKNRGICHATNRALGMASGEYLAFLDHDDRLSPDAFYYVVEALNQDPCLDVIYSDRDMLSTSGLRFMHLFKPDFSPELLFSMNYICHLMVYKKTLIDQVGGIHSKFEGSQDYDLILRVMELNPVVHHIARVLYHWRQSELSVALNHNAKDYAYKAGVLALKHALKRRGLQGDVDEISNLWRGHYRVRLTPPDTQSIALFEIDAELPADLYVQYIEKSIASARDKEFIIFKGSKLVEIKEQDENLPAVTVKSLPAITNSPAVMEMASWFQILDVGFVTAKIIDTKDQIIHAGLVQRKSREPLSVYQGFCEKEPGYIASTAVVKNVSVPHPFCFAVRRSIWEETGGFDQAFKGTHALLDFANRAGRSGIRVVYTPFAKFRCPDDYEMSSWVESDAELYFRKWKDLLNQGDPYYNKHLTLDLADMGLDYVNM